MYLCSGGFPEQSSEAPRTLTIIQGKSISMISSNSTIIDFLSLPSSPYLSGKYYGLLLAILPVILDDDDGIVTHVDCQKPVALVILAKNEMIIHDLTTPG